VVRRWLAALVVAAIVTGGLAAPGAAQSCGDFASQKDAQRYLEQVGGAPQLDPDGNGYACDGISFGGGTVINSDGPVASDSAGGVSGTTTVVNNPGARAERANAGSGNQTRERRDRSDRGNRGNNGGDSSGVAAEPDAGGAPVDGGGGQEVAAAGGTSGAPIQLPNTGSGRAATPSGAAVAVFLAALAALGLGVRRRAWRT
jgi:hypothetical protein